MPALLPPEAVWIAIALAALLLVVGSLRTMGVDVENTLRVHRLRVDVRRIRLEHARRLREIEEQREADKAARIAPRGEPMRPPYVKLRSDTSAPNPTVHSKAA